MKLEFLRELDTRCRDYLSMSHAVWDVAAVCFCSRVIDNQHVNERPLTISRFVRRGWKTCQSSCNSFAIWRRTSARRTKSLRPRNSLPTVLFGERPAAEVLLAFEGESAIGFAVFFHNFSTWLGRPGLYLEDLFVKPEKRGKGYGRALLVELAKIARDRGCGRMEWAVLDWNEPAIKFYRALGAKPMDEWTVFRLTRDGIEKLAEIKGAVAVATCDSDFRSRDLLRGFSARRRMCTLRGVRSEVCPLTS